MSLKLYFQRDCNGVGVICECLGIYHDSPWRTNYHGKHNLHQNAITTVFFLLMVFMLPKCYCSNIVMAFYMNNNNNS